MNLNDGYVSGMNIRPYIDGQRFHKISISMEFQRPILTCPVFAHAPPGFLANLWCGLPAFKVACMEGTCVGPCMHWDNDLRGTKENVEKNMSLKGSQVCLLQFSSTHPLQSHFCFELQW